MKASLSLRRLHNIEREQSVKQMEDQNFQRLKDRQAHSLYQHKMGSKLSIHSHGIPIDPVNLFYENTEKGKTQAKLDYKISQVNVFIDKIKKDLTLKQQRSSNIILLFHQQLKDYLNI